MKMAEKLIEFSDGSYLTFDDGKFDSWCVYLRMPNGESWIPKDVEYFEWLVEYGKQYGSNKIYNDFIKFYDVTTQEVEESVKRIIDEISLSYGDDREMMKKIFSIIYMAMIAENNKKNTKLGKRIKRLGIYCLLVKGYDAKQAASFMRHMKAYEIDKLCKQFGF